MTEAREARHGPALASAPPGDGLHNGQLAAPASAAPMAAPPLPGSPQAAGPARPDRRDVWVAGVLGLAAVLARLPFRSHILNTWDSVLFALGIDHYDVTAARPHPPGYPVYVFLGWLAHHVWRDENTALVAVSLLLTGASVAALYLLVRQWTGRPAATAASALFGLSPVLLHNSVIATSYPGEAFFSILVALAAWRVRTAPTDRTLGRSAWLGAAFALALGFRASLLFFLAPLVAWALVWPQPGGGPEPVRVALRRVRAAAISAAPVGLAWAIPMVVLSGGVRAYLAATRIQSGYVVFSESVFQLGRAAWDPHWMRFALYLDAETHVLLPSAVLVVVVAVVALVARVAAAGRTGFPRPSAPAVAWLLLWIAPPVAFYLLVFDGWDKGPDGYILCVLPAIYLAFGWLADAAWRVCRAAYAGAGPTWQTWVGRVAAVGIVVLCVVPGAGLAARWQPMHDREVRDHEAWAQGWAGLPAAFPPSDTAIVTSYSWAHVKWSFPQYTVWSYLRIPVGPGSPWALTLESHNHTDDVGFYTAHEQGPTGRSHAVPAAIRHVVVFDFQLAGENGGPRELRPEVQVREAHLPNGWRILVFDTDAAHPTVESYFTQPGNTPAVTA